MGDVKINFTLTPLKVSLSLTLAVTHLVVNEVFETITTHSCLTFYNVDEQRQSRSHPFDLISDHYFFTSSFTSDNVKLSAAIRTWQPCRDLRRNNVK